MHNAIALAAQRVYIIVHGTWATESEWHQPGGDFFSALEQTVNLRNGRVVSFTWSGNNDHFSRKVAAENLAKLIQSYPLSFSINIVAHSHGSNVAILASQILGNNDRGHRVQTFYGLATPVSTVSYMPNMDIIRYFYNLYSLGDKIQTVFDLFEREFPEHPRRANIRLMVNGQEPSHSELHCPLAATWIPFIHEGLAAQHIGGFDLFDFGLDANIYLFDDRVPLYALDFERKQVLAQDRTESRHLLQSFMSDFGRQRWM